MRTAKHLLRSVTHWHVESQQQARRNALVATTALTARRLERLEVEEHLAAAQHRRDARVARSAALG